MCNLTKSENFSAFDHAPSVRRDVKVDTYPASHALTKRQVQERCLGVAACFAVNVINTSPSTVALFTELRLKEDPAAMWSDNYVTLLPGETRTVVAASVNNDSGFATARITAKALNS